MGRITIGQIITYTKEPIILPPPIPPGTLWPVETKLTYTSCSFDKRMKAPPTDQWQQRSKIQNTYLILHTHIIEYEKIELIFSSTSPLGLVNVHVFTLNPIHPNPISNPTPLQTDPNWSGHLMHPNSRGSRMHPKSHGSRVHPHDQGK